MSRYNGTKYELRTTIRYSMVAELCINLLGKIISLPVCWLEYEVSARLWYFSVTLEDVFTVISEYLFLTLHSYLSSLIRGGEVRVSKGLIYLFILLLYGVGLTAASKALRLGLLDVNYSSHWEGMLKLISMMLVCYIFRLYHSLSDYCYCRVHIIYAHHILHYDNLNYIVFNFIYSHWLLHDVLLVYFIFILDVMGQSIVSLNQE